MERKRVMTGDIERHFGGVACVHVRLSYFQLVYKTAVSVQKPRKVNSFHKGTFSLDLLWSARSVYRTLLSVGLFGRSWGWFIFLIRFYCPGKLFDERR